jgi:hypothetical protein
MWATGLHGSSTIGRIETDIDISFGDILDDLKIGAMLDFRAEYGRGAVQANLVYALMESEEIAGPFQVKAEPSLVIIEFDGRYKMTEHWELLGGVRAYIIDVDINVTGPLGFSLNPRETWVDPMLGAAFSYPFTDRWSINGRGDIGGFGVGSDFSWQVSAFFDYRFGKSKRHSLVLGWRHLDWDYKADGGGRNFELDTYMTGPIIGARFRF